jgi:O-antigen/teichoic acid export membrane protein
MSRIKRFTHSLISGYALLGGNIVFSLASVPLALHYLTDKEFGLWALITQLANFNMMVIDLGISGALSRVLIDHKDNRETSDYGTVIQTGTLVLIVQALLIAVSGSVISYWLPGWMKIDVQFHSIFRVLMICQCVILGIAFAGRIFSFILQAHQRYDVSNYANLGGFALNLIALWLSFHFRLGLYSMLTGFVVSTLFGIVCCTLAVRRLGFLPAKGLWGRPNRATFREIFFFGADIFLISIGQQLIAMSQGPVITRTLGLEATAVWSVAVKVFVMGQQLIYRIFDFSGGAFAEMVVRGEPERLKARYRDLLILTGSAAAAVGMTMALCNPAAVRILTHGRLSWGPQNNLLMAVSLFVYSLTRLPFGFVGVTKKVGAMKYIYFLEGLSFVGLGLLSAPHLGFAGIIGSGIVTNLLFSGVYGTRRTVAYFRMGYAQLFRDWFGRPLTVFASSAIAAFAVWLLIQQSGVIVQLAAGAGLFGLIAVLLFWRAGVPEHLRKEALGRLGSLRVIKVFRPNI